MSLIRYTFIAGVLALSTSWALAAPQTTIAIKPKEDSEAAAGKAAELRQASTVLLLTEKGKQLGSGVLVSRGNRCLGGYQPPCCRQSVKGLRDDCRSVDFSGTSPA